MRQFTSLGASVASTLLLVACAHDVGAFIWVDSYVQPARAVEKEYLIAPGDLIAVRVYNQDAMSGRMRVRNDGRVTLPFIGDVAVAGSTPTALAEMLARRFRDYVTTPVITVSLEEPRPFEVYVVGEVSRPGRYALEPGASVLQALAAAGGLTELAERDRIFVVRQTPAPTRVRFRYQALTRLQGKAAGFHLMLGDTVVVE